jgi:hypothetical protein
VSGWQRDLTYGPVEGTSRGYSSEFRTRVYARREYSESWNQAVSGPAFWSLPAYGGCWNLGGMSFFADPDPNRSGSVPLASATYTRRRAGKTLGRFDLTDPDTWRRCYQFQAGDQLVVDARRSAAYGPLSASLNITWTVARKQNWLPPLKVVRLAPRGLDDHNSAPVGSATVIPLTVQRPPGQRGTVQSVKAEFSTDGGRTWKAAPVAAAQSGWTTTVANPAATGMVSLRITVTDTDGNAVTQTVGNAYRVR